MLFAISNIAQQLLGLLYLDGNQICDHVCRQVVKLCGEHGQFSTTASW